MDIHPPPHCLVNSDLLLMQLAWESKAAERVDDFLESYVGIRDIELGEKCVCVCLCHVTTKSIRVHLIPESSVVLLIMFASATITTFCILVV